jgi:hypothetical protein
MAIHSLTPGKVLTFCGVARNVQQWRASVEYQDVDDDSVDLPSLTNPKSKCLDDRLQFHVLMECHLTNTRKPSIHLNTITTRDFFELTWIADVYLRPDTSTYGAKRACQAAIDLWGWLRGISENITYDLANMPIYVILLLGRIMAKVLLTTVCHKICPYFDHQG